MDVKNSYKKFVIDASVIIKWFAENEADKIQADKLKEDYTNARILLLAPALAVWEVGNFLGRVYTEENAVRSFNIFKNYRITQAMLTLEGASAAFRIMKKCPKVSFYDASYHALAMEHGATFLTGDESYYEKAQKLGNVMLLKNY